MLNPDYLPDWILTLTVLFRYCYNVDNVVDLSRYWSHSTSFNWHQSIITTENYPYQELSQNLWYFDEIKKKLMKSFFHYCHKKNWIDFGIRSLYNLFLPLCSWEVIAFFSQQDPPPSFLPNGAKPLRLEHESSQNLIRICQFVI